MSATVDCRLRCQRITALWVLLMCTFGQYVESHSESISSILPLNLLHGDRRVLRLVEEPPLILTYHNGLILSQGPSIPLYVLWYGTFSNGQRSTIHDFLASISSAQPKPSANSWWKLTEGYKTTDGNTVAGSLSLAAELSDSVYSKGKSLTEADLETLILSSLGTFPTNPHAIYMLLTASDVTVENFCMNSCASHFATSPSNATHGQQLPFVWVGNAATQCPGNCAWPFARAEYGPPTAPLLPPNGDVGIDGMIINIGSMLAGTATNPFNNGYYQGDGGAPLEAATACAGIYGPGAYPGYPGDLLTDKTTGASYNANGIKNRTFLLPALWDPSTLLCTPP